MSKKGDLHSETRHLILTIRKLLDELNGEKTTIRFLLYKLIGMKDSFGCSATKIETTADYAKLTSAINAARIRQGAQDERIRRGEGLESEEVYGLPDAPFVDNKRQIRGVSGYENVSAFVNKVKNWYERDLWQDQYSALFLLVEKATVGDVLESVASKYQVPLCVSMGYFGRTFMLEIAERLKEAVNKKKHVYIGYVGDHDPSGLDMEESLRIGNDKEGSQCAVGLEQLMTEGYWNCFDSCKWHRIAVRTDEFEAMDDLLKVDIKQLEKERMAKS